MIVFAKPRAVLVKFARMVAIDLLLYNALDLSPIAGLAIAAFYVGVAGHLLTLTC